MHAKILIKRENFQTHFSLKQLWTYVLIQLQMNLSITKKATVIYKANSFLVIIFLSFQTLAIAQDLSSFCFDKSVSLRNVQQSLAILLLPKDIVDQRADDNCLDIVTTADRGNLFEKFLSKRYELKKDPSGNSGVDSRDDKECRIDLKTTKKSNEEGSNYKIGEKNIANKSETTKNSVSTLELLLGSGFPGEIEAGNEKLKVTCQLIGNDSASITFSYAEKSSASASSQVLLKKGEWLNIASVLKDLEAKGRTLGIPQTEINQTTGKSETIYEIQFK